jgi:hypothetical protein
MVYKLKTTLLVNLYEMSKGLDVLWANQQKIRQIYEDANRLGLVVDHIIPLQHPLVCGLHVWDNLQLLSRSENARKNNKFDSDILAVIE